MATKHVPLEKRPSFVEANWTAAGLAKVSRLPMGNVAKARSHMTRLLSSYSPDPIEFLVRRKFPLPRVHLSPLAPSRASTKFEERRFKETSDYREALTAMPADDFAALLKSEQDKEISELRAKAEAEEQARFYNQPHATADVLFWSKAAYWTLEEAIALSFGKNPQYVNWESLSRLRENSSFIEKYRRLRDLATRAIYIQKLFDPVLPGFYLQWIKTNGLEFPKDLEAAVIAHAGAFADWKGSYDELFAMYESHKADWKKMAKDWRGQALKDIEERDAARQQLNSGLEEAKKTVAPETSLGKRERESMLKLIAAMAIGGYGHDPKATRSDTVKSITDDLERAGMTLSDDTVRRYLTEAIAFFRDSLA
jgi:hypothetical protein